MALLEDVYSWYCCFLTSFMHIYVSSIVILWIKATPAAFVELHFSSLFTYTQLLDILQ